MAVAQWARLYSSEHRVVQAEGLSPGRDTYQAFFSAMIFISVLSRPIDFSDIVMLRSGPVCCQQNLKCFDMPLLSLGLFSGKSINDC